MSLYFVYTTGNSGVISPVLLLYRKFSSFYSTICSIQYQEYFTQSNAEGNAEGYSILPYLQANCAFGVDFSKKLLHNDPRYSYSSEL